MTIENPSAGMPLRLTPVLEAATIAHHHKCTMNEQHCCNGHKDDGDLHAVTRDGINRAHTIQAQYFNVERQQTCHVVNVQAVATVGQQLLNSTQAHTGKNR
eukprot:708321-Amphidinium_carterae.1